MVQIHLTDTALTEEILVIGLARKGGKRLVIESGDIALDTKTLLATLADVGATGKSDEVIKLPGTTMRLLVFTGLGNHHRNYPPEILRRAAGAATRELAGNARVAYSLPAADLAAVAAIAEGAALGAYSFDQFRGSTKTERKTPVSSINVHTSFARKTKAKEIAHRAQIIGDEVRH